MTLIQAFDNGANAMQSRIAAWLTIKGHIELAAEALTLLLPEYLEPEHIVVSADSRSK